MQTVALFSFKDRTDSYTNIGKQPQIWQVSTRYVQVFTTIVVHFSKTMVIFNLTEKGSK